MDTGDMGDAHWTFTIPLGAEDVRMLVEETIDASCMLSEVKQDVDSISDTSNVTLLAILSLRLENYMLHRSTNSFHTFSNPVRSRICSATSLAGKVMSCQHTVQRG